MIHPPPLVHQVTDETKGLIRTLIVMGCDTPIIDAVFSVECARRAVDYRDFLLEGLRSPEFVQKVSEMNQINLDQNLWHHMFQFIPEYLALVYYYEGSGKQWRNAWENPEHTYWLRVIDQIRRIKYFNAMYPLRTIVDDQGNLTGEIGKMNHVQRADSYKAFSELIGRNLVDWWHHKRPHQS